MPLGCASLFRTYFRRLTVVCILNFLFNAFLLVFASFFCLLCFLERTAFGGAGFGFGRTFNGEVKVEA